jgi:hypothetical protein
VDPGRAKPGISVWHFGKLVETFSPNFKGKNGEERLRKIKEWIERTGDPNNIDLCVIETNSIASGKETGCYFGGYFAALGKNVVFVHPVHVALWAEKKFNVKLCNIPRHTKKKRTKELVELLMDKSNLTFDECDSILNYLYWKDVRCSLRHQVNPGKPDLPDQPRPATPL